MPAEGDESSRSPSDRLLVVRAAAVLRDLLSHRRPDAAGRLAEALASLDPASPRFSEDVAGHLEAHARATASEPRSALGDAWGIIRLVAIAGAIVYLVLTAPVPPRRERPDDGAPSIVAAPAESPR